MKEYSSTGIQILEAAKILFAEKGYRGVSTRKIAQVAEVNEVTLFRIFGTKEKLFEKTFEYFFFRPNFSSLFDLKELSFTEVLYSFGEVMHKFFVENIPLITMQIRNQDVIMKKNIDKFPNEVKHLLSSQFKKHKGLSDKVAELQAVCYMTALHGLCLNLYIFQSFTDNITFSTCLDILVDKFD